MPKEDQDGLPIPRRYWAHFTVALAVTMAVLDSAIANIALPSIARDVHATAASSIWVVNAYQLAITVSILPLAALGEIVEYRKVYRAGLAIFVVASLACSLSDSLLTLALARVLQGFGAAGIMCVNTALVRFIWPHAKLGKGIGINAIVVAVASAVGPTVASAILSVAPWQWLFLINIPIGIVALAASRTLPPSPKGSHRFDWLSAALSAGTFGLLIAGIDGVGHGQHIYAVAGELAGAVLIGFILVWRQLSQAWPLFPIDLLGIPIFAISVATSICSFLAQMMAYVSLPFFLENALGRSAVETGMLITPWPLMTAVVAPIAGRLADRHSAGILGGIGLAIFAAGLTLLAVLPSNPASLDIAWRMAVCGTGFGLFQSPNNRAIVTAAPRNRSGSASGMLATARLLGQTVGAAMVALCFGLFPNHGTRSPSPSPPASRRQLRV